MMTAQQYYQQEQSKYYLPSERLVNTFIEKKDNTFNPWDWDSLFIPCLPPCLMNEETLTHIIESVLQIGSVKRIDIVKKENVENRYMAFIHFNYWMDDANIHSFREKIDKETQVDVYGILDYRCSLPKMGFNRLLYGFKNLEQLNNNFYIRFFKNKTPIKETELNIHQLADLLGKADIKNDQNKDIIENMSKEIAELKRKLAFYEEKELVAAASAAVSANMGHASSPIEQTFIQSSYM